MNHNDNIDDIFKKGLGNDAHSEIPESFLNDINAKLDSLEKKKKRRGLWFWFVPGLFIGSLIVYGLNNNSSNTDKVSTATTTANTKTNETNKNLTSTNANTGTKELAAVNTVSIKEKNEPENDKTNIPNSNSKKANTPDLQNPTPRKNTSRINRSKKLNSITNESTKEDDKNKTVIEEKSKSAIQGDVVIANDLHNSGNNGLKTDSISTVKEEQTIQKDSATASTETDTTLPNTNPPPPVAPPKKTKNSSLKFSIDLLAGSQFVFKNVEGNDTPHYIQRRKEEEDPIFRVDVAALFNAQLNNYSLTTGITYAQWGEKIKYETSIVEDYFYYWQVDSLTGDSTYVTGSTNKSVTAVKDKNGINKYNYINIPFLLGYEVKVSDNFSLLPKIGGTAGIQLRNSKRPYGYYLNVDEYLSEHTAVKFIFNWQASIDFRFKLNKLNFVVTPGFRHNINYMVKDDVMNKYKAFFLNFGVSFDF